MDAERRSAGGSSTDARVEDVRWTVLASALCYTAFVIYGSLVPFHFHRLPWAQAVEQFHRISYLSLGIGSRADWVANLLLFIPLAFFWLGVVWRSTRTRSNAIVSLGLFGACVGLSVSIEFIQIYVPPRTVSLNDIYAETLGATVGIAMWWATGPKFVRWLGAWSAARSHLQQSQRLALVYIVLLFGYGLLPLDLTLSPVEIYHKFRQGKINLLPFALLSNEPARAIYELASDSLLWFVPAFLWRWTGRHSPLKIWTALTASALLLEFLQLFVYSRVSDVTDVITAGLGAACGVWVAGFYGDRAQIHPAAKNGAHPLLPLVLALAWLLVIVAVFWYPFNVRIEGDFVRPRLEMLTRLPFLIYYYGTEFRAVTEVFHKILFFAPLGGLLAWLVRSLPWHWRSKAAALSIIVLGGVSLLMEVGQAFIPGKFPDSTDLVLEFVGGLMGYGMFRMVWARHLPKPQMLKRSQAMEAAIRVARRSHRQNGTHVADITADTSAEADDRTAVLPRPEDVRQDSGYGFWGDVAVVYGIMAFLVAGLTLNPLAPYNVRELLSSSVPWLSVLLLAALPLLLWLPPIYFAVRVQQGRIRMAAFFPLIQASAIWLLLTIAVPAESMDDIVGSPILNCPEWLERWMRSIALFGGWSAVATCAVMPLITRAARPWLVCAGLTLGWLLIAHWGVVTEAATDNLTELMAGGGNLYSTIMLAGAVGALMTASALVSRAFFNRMRARLPGLAVVPVPIALAVVGLWLGLGHDIHKYHQTFSAAQFLLSRGRDNYASGLELALRGTVAICAVVGAGALVQWPVWRKLANADRSRERFDGGRNGR